MELQIWEKDGEIVAVETNRHDGLLRLIHGKMRGNMFIRTKPDGPFKETYYHEGFLPESMKGFHIVKYIEV